MDKINSNRLGFAAEDQKTYQYLSDRSESPRQQQRQTQHTPTKSTPQKRVRDELYEGRNSINRFI